MPEKVTERIPGNIWRNSKRNPWINLGIVEEISGGILPQFLNKSPRKSWTSCEKILYKSLDHAMLNLFAICTTPQCSARCLRRTLSLWPLCIIAQSDWISHNPFEVHSAIAIAAKKQRLKSLGHDMVTGSSGHWSLGNGDIRNRIQRLSRDGHDNSQHWY